jgi:hypothetical protein
MFSIDKKQKFTIGVILLLSLALTTPAIAGTIVGGTLTIVADPEREVMPAIAYNNDRQEYLVVWYNDRADNDDIRGQRLDRYGAKISGPFFIVGGNDGNDRRYPDVAYDTTSKQYLVVWENQDTNNLDVKSIRARRVSGTGAILDNSDIIITGDSPLYTPTKPAVAYASTANRYMIVWEEWVPAGGPSFSIKARKVTPAGATEGLEVVVSTSSYLHSNPDIAYNRHADQHLVVWDEKAGSGQPIDVNGRFVTGAGGTPNPEFPIGIYTVDSTNPSVAAIPTSPGNIKFMVVYEILNNPGNHRIYGDFINEDGTIAKTVYPAMGSNNETAPAVAGSEGAQEYLIVWHEDAGIMDNPIKARQYTSAGVDMGVTYELGGPATNFPAVAAGQLGDFLIAWQDQPIGATNEHIFGSLFGYRNYLPLVNH